MDGTFKSHCNISAFYLGPKVSVLTEMEGGNETVITFDGLFGNRELKSVCITFAVIFVPINLVLLYSIIWYEHFGVDAKQTIINKFLSSACWTCIAFIIFVQVPGTNSIKRFCRQRSF